MGSSHALALKDIALHQSDHYWCVTCRLRTHIGRLFIVVDVMDVSGQAKVSNLHHVAFCDQDVSGSQVSVNTLWGRAGQEEG